METDAAAQYPDPPVQCPSLLSRYYFNLTDGETMIRDEEGVEASSIQVAVLSAMEAVEELRGQEPLDSDDWQGWRLEIVDATGQAVQTVPLDAFAVN
ncbi:hypothetical protein MAE02_69520 [Microvirga aerophila]|uniref:DUF6894 domain-containing protein n=1 Tax=Microvirga aerophila TaxID=670291 RepID=A0A512C4V2_9HYPH|nr:hypothetical protein MAE02_69520 [Microvirga aerophila]